MIDKNSIDDYLKLVNFNTLDENYFTVIEFIKTDKNKFHEKENKEPEFRNIGLKKAIGITTKRNLLYIISNLKFYFSIIY